MGVFDDEIAFVESWKVIIEDSVKEAFRRYDFVIIDYLTNKQWFQKGQKSDGGIIKPVYTRITIKLKQKKGDPYDRVTLRDTGKLYRSIDLIIGERALIARVTVEYFRRLELKYGKKILGIQDKFIEEFTENYILPQIKKNLDDSITAL